MTREIMFAYDFIKVHGDGNREWYDICEQTQMFVVKPGYKIRRNNKKGAVNEVWYNEVWYNVTKNNKRVGEFCIVEKYDDDGIDEYGDICIINVY